MRKQGHAELITTPHLVRLLAFQTSSPETVVLLHRQEAVRDQNQNMTIGFTIYLSLITSSGLRGPSQKFVCTGFGSGDVVWRGVRASAFESGKKKEDSVRKFTTWILPSAVRDTCTPASTTTFGYRHAFEFSPCCCDTAMTFKCVRTPLSYVVSRFSRRTKSRPCLQNFTFYHLTAD